MTLVGRGSGSAERTEQAARPPVILGPALRVPCESCGELVEGVNDLYAVADFLAIARMTPVQPVRA